MSFASIKSKFHVALDGQGLILQGAPDRLAYQSGQASVYGSRFASGDRSYNDLSQWWYFAQTSWTAGFKHDVSWADDAKYYYSTNMDAHSENGAIKLANTISLDNDFTEQIYYGIETIIGSGASAVSYTFIGTAEDATSKPRVYSHPIGSGSWVNETSAYMSANRSQVPQILGRGGILWFTTLGTDATQAVNTWDGTTFTDQTTFIKDATILNWGGSTKIASRTMAVMDDTAYIFVYDENNNKWGLVKTAVNNPSAAANYTKLIEKTNTKGIPSSSAIYGGNLYYLLTGGSQVELRMYNLTSSVDSHVTFFKNFSISDTAFGDRSLAIYDNKLIITVTTEAWTYNGSVLTRIFANDTQKGNLLFTSHLDRGAMVADNKVWWGNLMWDGTYFFNWIKDIADTAIYYPLFVSNAGIRYGYDTADQSKLYIASSNYKGTADKNFLIFNNFDLVSGVDKLAYSATILFKPLVTGQAIIVEYFLGELASNSTWTVLGTASFSVDGGVVTDKILYFGAATTFKKIWIRIKMESGGSDTPTMTDFIMEYLPFPTYKKDWTLNINCGDDVKRLDGALVETTGRELKGRLERAWWTKSILDFQDIDYATTLLSGALNSTATTITVDSTADFPEQGRLRVDDEEVTYTGKTPTTFTGCTRGARSTRAVSHADDAVINNAYKVILTNLSARIPIALEDNELEYTMGINIREV